MRKSPLIISLLLTAPFILAATAVRADDARVEVATVDGAPVYHWRTFKSFFPDDVDRALIIRDFHRQKLKLPTNLVDDAVKQQIADQFAGSSDKFTRHLHDEGVTLADFRAFVTEEIITNAMLNQDAKTPAEAAKKQAAYLAKLREGVNIKRLSSRAGSHK